MTDTNYREKARAVFLAFVMVTSVFGATVAFSGSAAAVSAPSDASADDIAINANALDQEVQFTTTVEDGDAGAEIPVDFSAATGAGVVVSSQSVDKSGSGAGDVTVGTNDVNLGAGNLDVEFTDDSVDGESHEVTVTLTLTHDTTGLGAAARGTSLTYTVGSGSDAVDADFNVRDIPGDVNLDSGSTYWAGQGAGIQLDPDVDADGTDEYDPDATVQVREYDKGDRNIEGVVDEIVLSSYTATVDTDDLSGDYVLVPDGDSSQAFEIDDGTIDNLGQPAAGYNPSFEVTQENLGIEFADADGDTVDSIDEDSTTFLDTSSNRGTYDLVVSSNGDIDAGPLAGIFSANTPSSVSVSQAAGQYEDDYDIDDNSAIVVSGVEDFSADDEDYELDFQDIDVDDYEFDFYVTDTGAEASVPLSIDELDQGADFQSGVITDSAGDVVSMSVNLTDRESAYVQIGDEDSGFIDVVYIEDDDDDDNVEFEVNTRTLGTQTAGAPTANVYNSEDDIVTSQIHGGGLGNIYYTNDDTDSPTNFATYLEELGLIENDGDGDDDDNPTDQLTRPLQATDYDLTVGAANDDGTVFGEADGASEVGEQYDSALLELEQPSIGEINTWVAPGDSADEDDSASEILDTVTQRSEVAIDDRLVIQVEATGFEGALTASNNDNFDTIEDGVTLDTFNNIIDNDDANNWHTEGISFSVEAASATGNQDATELDLTNDDTSDALVVFDPASEQFFVVVDTSADDDVFTDELSDGETFTASMDYVADADDRYAFNYDTGTYQGPYDGEAGGDDPAAAGDEDEAFPYLAAGSDAGLSSSAEFDAATRSITFDNLNENEELQAQATEDAVISGETNVAPGSDAELRVASTDASTSFRSGEDANITSDGAVSATFDLSGQEVGDQFETSLTTAGTEVGSTDSVIVEAIGDDTATNETDDGSMNETDDGDMDDGETEPADDGETNESTDDGGESTDDGTPGFGAVVALVALVGAALLAVRRQN